MNIISQAEKYVYISTPYFVVDDEMLKTITNASKSGVDVRIVVPHIPDKKIVNQVTKSFYLRLIEAGVNLTAINTTKSSIEDYYLRVIGGAQNA